MALGMDEGDILLQESWNVSEEDTTGTLFARTGERAGPLLMEALEWLVAKTLTPLPQDHGEASYTKMIEKKDGELQSSWTIHEAYQAWQAYTPWPSLFIFYNDIKISLLKIKKMKHETWKMKHEKSIFSVIEGLPAIQLADGFLLIETIHPAGKKPMTGEEFVRGFMKS